MNAARPELSVLELVPVSPGRTRYCLAPLRQQLTGSASASAVGSSSHGASTRLPRSIASRGTSRYSASPPSISYPKSRKFSHRCSRPARHWRQRPHERTIEHVACTPTSTPSTPSPTAATLPANSWPRITPERTPAVFAPEMMRRSVPQIVFASTLRRTSPGPGSGTGTRVRDRSSMPCRTAAFMLMRLAYAFERPLPHSEGRSVVFQAGRRSRPWAPRGPSQVPSADPAGPVRRAGPRGPLRRRLGGPPPPASRSPASAVWPRRLKATVQRRAKNVTTRQ